MLHSIPHIPRLLLCNREELTIRKELAIINWKKTKYFFFFLKKSCTIFHGVTQYILSVDRPTSWSCDVTSQLVNIML